MAVDPQDPVLAKRRFFNAATIDAAAYNISIAFWSWLMQQGGKPSLQVVEFGALTATETIALAGAAKLYAVLLNKPTTTAGFTKLADHNTTYSEANGVAFVKQAAVKVDLLLFPKGMALATGLVLVSHTTMDGTTTSAAGDGSSGVVLLGAA